MRYPHSENESFSKSSARKTFKQSIPTPLITLTLSNVLILAV